MTWHFGGLRWREPTLAGWLPPRLCNALLPGSNVAGLDMIASIFTESGQAKLSNGIRRKSTRKPNRNWRLVRR
jgi:hypothetical protein